MSVFIQSKDQSQTGLRFGTARKSKKRSSRILLLTTFLLLLASYLFPLQAQPLGCPVKWDAKSIIMNGKRVVPVMGEIHYSRLPEAEWRDEVRKMKEGGVTIIATYVFWNHIEEVEDQFDWSGQRNLRRFLEICKDEQLPVVLRIGPFCHGEVRCGGIPDWVLTKGCRLRSEEKAFLGLVEKLYRQIFTQVQGLQWKDGGPVLACQFDNEYRGRGSYLMALKRIALNIGFDLPFYTRTGWPELASPVPYGEMIPLYGDYADGFWERSIKEGTGNYHQAFQFKAPVNLASQGAAMGAMDAASEESKSSASDEEGNGSYPYFTCELGGGMMTSYHRRVYLYPEDAYSMALVKLGCGSNLLGYYMYHGGTNPEGKLTYLNEVQRTPVTNYNDLPVKTYDFQAPLGEFGQPNPHYYSLRRLHLFMHDFGELLAPMQAVFPSDPSLRWSYRTDGHSAFVFINNYARFENLDAKKNVQLSACGVSFPRLTIPAGCMAIFPVNIQLDGTQIEYATAQLIAQREGKVYLAAIEGVPTTIKADGKILKNIKPQGLSRPIYKNLYLLTGEEASHLFLPSHGAAASDKPQSLPSGEGRGEAKVSFSKVKEATGQRTITIGVNKVAEEPVDEDFDQAATYVIHLPQLPATTPSQAKPLLTIRYRGDCARLYAVTKEGKSHFVADNFYNGRPFLYGLWRLPADTDHLELRILPLQSQMPIYFPREADTTPGEQVISIDLPLYQGF